MSEATQPEAAESEVAESEAVQPGELNRTDRRALSAVAVQFFVNGALFASFLPRLPEIRDRVGVTTAGLGLLMSLAGVSGLVSSLLVGRVIDRWGTRRVVLVCGSVISAALGVVGLATTPVLLLVGLVGMLSLDLFVDVSMNMQGSWLSARRHTPVMNRLHGLWSLGTMMGGFASSRIAAAGISLTAHLIVAGVVLFVALGYVGRGMLRVDEHESEVAPSAEGQSKRKTFTLARPNPTLILFFLIGAFAIAMESTSTDWAAFRLSDDFALSAGTAAFGYVAVTIGMTTGRLGGDWALARLGQQRLTQLSMALTAAGLSTACFAGNYQLVLVGYVAAGLGQATMFPAIYDAAAKHKGRPGAGLGALSAGLRMASLLIPVTVGALTASSLSIGQAVALVTLPSVAGFAVIQSRMFATSRDGAVA